MSGLSFRSKLPSGKEGSQGVMYYTMHSVILALLQAGAPIEGLFAA